MPFREKIVELGNVIIFHGRGIHFSLASRGGYNVSLLLVSLHVIAFPVDSFGGLKDVDCFFAVPADKTILRS